MCIVWLTHELIPSFLPFPYPILSYHYSRFPSLLFSPSPSTSLSHRFPRSLFSPTTLHSLHFSFPHYSLFTLLFSSSFTLYSSFSVFLSCLLFILAKFPLNLYHCYSLLTFPLPPHPSHFSSFLYTLSFLTLSSLPFPSLFFLVSHYHLFSYIYPIPHFLYSLSLPLTLSTTHRPILPPSHPSSLISLPPPTHLPPPLLPPPRCQIKERTINLATPTISAHQFARRSIMPNIRQLPPPTHPPLFPLPARGKNAPLFFTLPLLDIIIFYFVQL